MRQHHKEQRERARLNWITRWQQWAKTNTEDGKTGTTPEALQFWSETRKENDRLLEFKLKDSEDDPWQIVKG